MRRLAPLMTLGLSLFSIAGCSGQRFVPLPDLGDDELQTVVVVADEGATADELTEDFQVTVDTVELSVLFYQATLGELGLEAGSLDGQTARDCQLTSPDRVYELVDEALSLSEPSDELLDVLVPDRSTRCQQCVDFEVVRLSLEEWEEDSGTDRDSRPKGAAWLESGDALLGRDYDGLFVASLSGTQRLSGCEGIRTESLLAIGGDRFLVGGMSRLFEIEVDQPRLQCTQTASMSDSLLNGTVMDMAGAWTDGDQEVFLAVSEGSLLRYSSSGFELVDTLPLDSMDLAKMFTNDSAVVRPEPGRAFFVSGKDEVLAYSGGSSSRKSLSLSVSRMERALALGFAPEAGVLLGTNVGRLLSERDDWREVPSGLEGGIGTILPFRGGFLVTNAGVVIQRTRSGDLCPMFGSFPGARHSGKHTIGTEDRILISQMVLSTSGQARRNSELIWLLAR